MHLAAGEAAIIPAGISHCLAPAGTVLRTIYVDPLCRGMRSAVQSNEVSRLRAGQATALKAVKCGHSARQWIEDYLGTEAARAIDRRLQVGLVGLEPGIGPAALAQRLGLSPGRLRELAVRDFGVPTAKLLQWLQLQRAIEALQQAQNLADAAAASGFADQSHFTRRLVEWFGVTPAQGLTRLEISVIR
jgi:AraC-like DNA-binding protein